MVPLMHTHETCDQKYDILEMVPGTKVNIVNSLISIKSNYMI